MILLDTCILIDLLRERAPAVDFVFGLVEKPAISAATATELIAGCRSARERHRVDRLIEHYGFYDIDREIACLAGEYVGAYGRSHGTDAMDALIAATAQIRKATLATLNLKHFPMFKDLKRPYAT